MDNVAAIKRGLIEGKIKAHFEMSRGGSPWTPLTEVEELSSYVRIAKRTTGEIRPPVLTDEPPPAPSDADRADDSLGAGAEREAAGAPDEIEELEDIEELEEIEALEEAAPAGADDVDEEPSGDGDAPVAAHAPEPSSAEPPAAPVAAAKGEQSSTAGLVILLIVLLGAIGGVIYLVMNSG